MPGMRSFCLEVSALASLARLTRWQHSLDLRLARARRSLREERNDRIALLQAVGAHDPPSRMAKSGLQISASTCLEEWLPLVCLWGQMWAKEGCWSFRRGSRGSIVVFFAESCWSHLSVIFSLNGLGRDLFCAPQAIQFRYSVNSYTVFHIEIWAGQVQLTR